MRYDELILIHYLNPHFTVLNEEWHFLEIVLRLPEGWVWLDWDKKKKNPASEDDYDDDDQCCSNPSMAYQFEPYCSYIDR